MIRCLASFNVDSSSTDTGETCSYTDNVWWYQIVGNENGVLDSHSECSAFDSAYFSTISDELELAYGYESGVNCATDYPLYQQCCEEFYYFEYSTIETCTLWQEFPPTQCYSECEAWWNGLSPWYYDCTYGASSYYLYNFYDYWYYETLTDEQEQWAEIIDANYFDIS